MLRDAGHAPSERPTRAPARASGARGRVAGGGNGPARVRVSGWRWARAKELAEERDAHREPNRSWGATLDAVSSVQLLCAKGRGRTRRGRFRVAEIGRARHESGAWWPPPWGPRAPAAGGPVRVTLGAHAIVTAPWPWSRGAPGRGKSAIVHRPAVGSLATMATVNAYLDACQRRNERPRENIAAALGDQGAVFLLGASALVSAVSSPRVLRALQPRSATPPRARRAGLPPPPTPRPPRARRATPPPRAPPRRSRPATPSPRPS